MGFKEDLLQTGLVVEQEIEGCSQEEVDALAKSIGRPLPKAYVEFLLAMGRKAGDFMAGTDTFWRHLSWLQKTAERLVAERSAAPLPESAFVFYMHQGYEFGYFLLDEGDDPPVYQFVTMKARSERVTDSLTGYFNEMLKLFRE
ncbi:SMI1/KNR4 family protein [Lysobacter enzymogenes]|uniref:SMI1/KNR4 family protein n=1 Tax=Lysobacter enzymogenes TaxID=69 RepID=A0A3N2RLI3_LYSEN|nr:SMI1/KNR4 family protein [Lysobacter enzymogenes]ROU08307.1 SMI1/KNR4 family protein [Lysobacter enzymogenes]